MIDNQVVGAPPDAWNYEFIVVTPVDHGYKYHSHYANGFEAEQVAMNINGMIVHNVRIQGVQYDI